MKVLACVFMAWPLFAQAEGAIGSGQSASAVRTISDEAFQRWVKEDNKLIEGILGSLTHIDLLLGDIERMIRQLPDFAAPPTVAAKPAPPPAPVVIEKTVTQEVPGPLGGWLPTLAGAALLALLAFWLGRKQGVTQQTAAPSKAPAAPVPQPSKPALEKRAAAVVPAAAPKPAAPAPIAEEAPPSPRFELPALQPEPGPVSAKLVAFEAAPSIEPAPSSSGDQALELAEIMLSMGLGHGATQTLTEQIRNEPKQALRHWLKLLDIYRKNGQQEEFERSAEELRLHFNVRPEDWHAQPGVTQSLENFPHIAKRLTELWGKPDCLVYMQNLLDDNRGGARSGFPQSVAEELLMLTAVMCDAHGFLPG